MPINLRQFSSSKKDQTDPEPEQTVSSNGTQLNQTGSTPPPEVMQPGDEFLIQQNKITGSNQTVPTNMINLIFRKRKWS